MRLIDYHDTTGEEIWEKTDNYYYIETYSRYPIGDDGRWRALKGIVLFSDESLAILDMERMEYIERCLKWEKL